MCHNQRKPDPFPTALLYVYLGINIKFKKINLCEIFSRYDWGVFCGAIFDCTKYFMYENNVLVLIYEN